MGKIKTTPRPVMPVVNKFKNKNPMANKTKLSCQKCLFDFDTSLDWVKPSFYENISQKTKLNLLFHEFNRGRV